MSAASPKRCSRMITRLEMSWLAMESKEIKDGWMGGEEAFVVFIYVCGEMGVGWEVIIALRDRGAS
ncbi:hypothetical protein M5K25_017320 [Dendrobium thyrsiflorum]|uniref:Uncharacterized protein n=1 Tax=Dendrobium thyrsiflorum TaxID=117978 RepID=A0ABD0UMI8_DENTH